MEELDRSYGMRKDRGSKDVEEPTQLYFAKKVGSPPHLILVAKSKKRLIVLIIGVRTR